jgi:hypothetical protein
VYLPLIGWMSYFDSRPMPKMPRLAR